VISRRQNRFVAEGVISEEPMDEIAQYNIQRWDAMVRARAVFTRPRLDLTPDSARAMVDPDGRLGAIAGQQVLCLASGGGQQSAAFALLGAEVTVFDLSPAQLQRDQEAAAHYQLTIKIEQGDMRDLSRFAPAAFDIVYHAYSLNFVPDARVVFREVARVIRAGGVYSFSCANPFLAGLTVRDWDGQGYPLSRPYIDGAQIAYDDEPWVFRGEVPTEAIARPREYRHTLSTLVNGLAENGFVITHLVEETLGMPDASAAPGSDEHWSAIAPPWLRFCAVFQ
jgi:2-polyprenyl-3-methyl-5-hydroxy-6-metoxy-1,4-benzoquinol methylase